MDKFLNLITPEIVFRSLFFGMGSVTAWFIIKWFKDLLSAKRRAEVDEINLTLQKFKSDNASKSLDQLIDSENKRQSGDSSNTH